MSKYLSRKWLLASLFGVTGCVAFLFTGKLTGAEFVQLAIGLVGLFGAADAAINWAHRNKSDPDNP